MIVLSSCHKLAGSAGAFGCCRCHMSNHSLAVLLLTQPHSNSEPERWCCTGAGGRHRGGAARGGARGGPRGGGRVVDLLPVHGAPPRRRLRLRPPGTASSWTTALPCPFRVPSRCPFRLAVCEGRKRRQGIVFGCGHQAWLPFCLSVVTFCASMGANSPTSCMPSECQQALLGLFAPLLRGLRRQPHRAICGKWRYGDWLNAYV